MRGIGELDVTGRTVLLRADLNTPLDGTKITDDGRIRASLPTITKLLGRGARILVLAHLGRPSGADYAERAAGGPSLRPVAARLAELLGQDVPLAADVVGESAAAVAAGLADGEIAMAENIRFEPAETSKDDAARAGLARQLAALAGPDGPDGHSGRYVGDGFGALHRKHASVYDLPALLPHAAGDLVLSELAVLHRLTESPQRPYAVVLGGAKPSDKLAVIANLLGSADRLIIGGGMSYTFLKAQGHEVGKSLLEEDRIPRVSELLAEAGRRGVEVVLPVDLVAATHYGADAEHEVAPVSSFPADRESLDMGPATRELFAAKLADAKTVFWNGPVGVFEFPAFSAGTRAVAEAISKVTPSGLTVVGGGDSAAAVRSLGFPDGAFTHISTGGGASLEYLEGRELPGLAALAGAAR
jgi:phosphoglycerate kinase